MGYQYPTIQAFTFWGWLKTKKIEEIKLSSIMRFIKFYMLPASAKNKSKYLHFYNNEANTWCFCGEGFYSNEPNKSLWYYVFRDMKGDKFTCFLTDEAIKFIEQGEPYDN